MTVNTDRIPEDTGKLDNKEWADFVTAVMVALTDESDSKWGTGDVLVTHTHGREAWHLDAMRIDRSNNGSGKWITVLARSLAERGVDVSEDTLRSRYRTSLAFPPDVRDPGVSWTVHRLMSEAKGGAQTAPARLEAFLAEMGDRAPSRRNAEVWLGRNPAADSAAAVARRVENDEDAAAEVVKAIASKHPNAVAAAVREDDVARAVAEDSQASLAVFKQEEENLRKRGIREPRAIEEDRDRKWRNKYGPGFVEIVALGVAAKDLAELADKFVTPEDGPGRYLDAARTSIEADLTKIRAAIQHVEDVMNGVIDTRIPDDISGLLS